MPTWDPQGARSFAFNGYRQVYESLVQHNADLTLVPGLAVSWEDLIEARLDPPTAGPGEAADPANTATAH
jgi:ABC-type transport system substrate-binding protein